MDNARDLARGGYPHGLVVTAGVQTAGRGRLGRSWQARPGSALLCTVLLRPNLPADRASLLSVAAAVAVSDMVEAVTERAAPIKWPNDILVPTVRGPGLGKIAGILIETSLAGDCLATAAIGIGVNLSDHPPDVPDAADLAEVAGRAISQAVALDTLLDRLSGTLMLLARSPSGLVATFRDRLVTLGQVVQVTDAAATYPAVAEDVDEAAALLVRTTTGERRRLLAGDVTLRTGTERPTGD
jgi:BirA family biotin operon repressor/biotin-[acetyl-CoA-carboxylase] ligase